MAKRSFDENMRIIKRNQRITWIALCVAFVCLLISLVAQVVILART